MAWSPLRRFNAGFVWVEQPGDYATLNSNHIPDSTLETIDSSSIASIAKIDRAFMKLV
jgi:hypothetical protein